jgi:hypothetical protein
MPANLFAEAYLPALISCASNALGPMIRTGFAFALLSALRPAKLPWSRLPAGVVGALLHLRNGPLDAQLLHDPRDMLLND